MFKDTREFHRRRPHRFSGFFFAYLQMALVDLMVEDEGHLEVREEKAGDTEPVRTMKPPGNLAFLSLFAQWIIPTPESFREQNSLPPNTPLTAQQESHIAHEAAQLLDIREAQYARSALHFAVAGGYDEAMQILVAAGYAAWMSRTTRARRRCTTRVGMTRASLFIVPTGSASPVSSSRTSRWPSSISWWKQNMRKR